MCDKISHAAKQGCPAYSAAVNELKRICQHHRTKRHQLRLDDAAKAELTDM